MKTVPEMPSSNFAVASSLLLSHLDMSPAPTRTTLPDEGVELAVGVLVGVCVGVAVGLPAEVGVRVGVWVGLLAEVGVRVGV